MGTGRFPGDCQSECQKACCPLVDPHVQTQPAVEIGGLEGKCEGRVARAWTQHDFTHATTNQFVDDGCGLCSGRIHAFKSVRCSGASMPKGRRQRHYVWVRTLFDPADLEPRRFYQLLTASVVPRPIAWVSTLSADGVGNLAPYSFFHRGKFGAADRAVHVGSDARTVCATSKRPANS